VTDTSPWSSFVRRPGTRPNTNAYTVTSGFGRRQFNVTKKSASSGFMVSTLENPPFAETVAQLAVLFNISVLRPIVHGHTCITLLQATTIAIELRLNKHERKSVYQAVL